MRYLNKGEEHKIRDLYKQSFDDSDKFIDYYFQERIHKNHILVEEKEDEIVSMLSIVPKRIRIRGELYDIGYIFAVATKEDYKNMGIMKNLLSKCLKDMDTVQRYFTFLLTSNFSYYESLGFLGQKEASLTGVNPKATTQETSIDMKHIIKRKATKEDFTTLSVYAKSLYMLYCDIYVDKTVDYFIDLEKELSINGGYIELSFYENDLIDYEIIDNSIEDVNNNKLMVRLINIRAFLRDILNKFYKADNTNYEGVVIDLTDHIIPDNNGQYVIIDNNIVEKPESFKEDRRIEMNISEFTNWLIETTGFFKWVCITEET